MSMVEGCLERVPVAAERDMRKILEAEPQQAPKLPPRPRLAQRLERLAQTLPSDDIYGARVAEELRQLLDMPVRTYFQYTPEALAAMYNAVERAGQYCGPLRVSAYRDVLEVIRRLFEDFRRQDVDHEELLELCMKLLMSLGEPMALERFAVPVQQEEQEPQPKCLEQRLRELSASCAVESPILQRPLVHYFYAASHLTDSEYPNWLYRKKIRPDFALDKLKTCPEERYTLAFEVAYAYGLERETEADSDFARQKLYDLLVEPVKPLLHQDLTRKE